MRKLLAGLAPFGSLLIYASSVFWTLVIWSSGNPPRLQTFHAFTDPSFGCAGFSRAAAGWHVLCVLVAATCTGVALFWLYWSQQVRIADAQIQHRNIPRPSLEPEEPPPCWRQWVTPTRVICSGLWLALTVGAVALGLMAVLLIPDLLTKGLVWDTMAVPGLGTDVAADFCVADPTLACPGNSLSVIVVGAGIAGLAAARDLAAASINVTVLEARDYLGGRIRTDPASGAELGAQYVHAPGGNPLVDLLHCAGANTSGVWGPAEQSGVFDTGGDVSFCPSLPRDLLLWSGRDPTSVYRDALQDFLAQSSLDPQQQATCEQAARLVNVLDDLGFDEGAALEAQREGCSQWRQLDWTRRATVQEDLEVRNFSRAVQHIADSAEGVTMRMNTVVTRVSTASSAEGNGGVAVAAAGGAAFVADAVLVTLPLGVLQAGTVEFDPALSERRQLALNHFAMGTLNKLWLFFETPWWRSSGLRFLYYAFADSGSGAGGVQGPGAAFEMSTSDVGHTWPSVLMWVGGDLNAALEGNETDAELAAAAMVELRRLWAEAGQDEAAVEDPVAYNVTRWGLDDLAGGGSYSFPLGGTGLSHDHGQERDVLAAADVDERLFFAGEHTMNWYSQTVHGAMLSGRRAAHMLVQSLCS